VTCPTIDDDGVTHLILWNPMVGADGLTRWPHDSEASYFQMHDHLIDVHGHAAFAEGAVSPEQMRLDHAEAHRVPADHLHGEPLGV
jgi:hypothetical protein